MDARKIYSPLYKHLNALLLIGLFMTALSLRFAYVFIAKSPNLFGGDGLRYFTMVQQIMTDHIYGYGSETPNSRVAPVFPLYASTVLSVFSQNINAFKWAQILLGSATLFPLYWYIKTVSRPWLVWTACIFMTIYPPFIYMTGLFYTETLFIFLLVSFFASWQYMWNAPSLRAVILSAVILSAAVLTRPVMVPVFAVAVLFLISYKKHRQWLLPFVATIVICFLPWMLRNWIVLHEFTPLAHESGNALLAGAYPYFKHDVDYKELEERFGNDQTRYGFYLIANGFRDHFLYFLKWFTYGKLKYLFQDMWFFNKEYFFWIQIKISSLFHHVILAFSLFAIPCQLLRRNFLALSLTCMIAFQLLFIPTPRYGTPFILLMLMLASSTVVWIQQHWPDSLWEKFTRQTISMLK